jgi:hypothetical protein
MAKFQIWYMRPEWFRRGILGTLLDANNLAVTHTHLKEIVLDAGDKPLEAVYRAMQGEVWSPCGEARGLIKSKGLQHTSMSVGDAVTDEAGHTFVVGACGFTQL